MIGKTLSRLIPAVAALLALGAASATAQEWTLDVEALYLHRDIVDDVDVAVFDNDPGGAVGLRELPVLSTSDLDLGWRPGARGTLGYSREAGRRWELSGFWLREHWDDQSVFDPTGDLESHLNNDELDLLDESVFNNFSVGRLDYEVDLVNLEGNYVRDLAPVGGIKPSLLLGLRYVSLDERFNLDTVDDNPPLGQDDIGLVKVETDNRLIGLQIGGRGVAALAQNLSLDMLAKFGLFANFAEQDTDWVSGLPDADTEIESARGSSSGTSLGTVTELAVTATLNVTERMDLALGYTMMHFGGVALAPLQFPQVNHPQSLQRLDTSGQALYHGLTARATYRLGTPAQHSAEADWPGRRTVLPAANHMASKTWTLDLEALYLHRDVPDDIGVVFFDAGAAPLEREVLSTDDLGLGFEPGARATVGYEPEAGRRWEASGFWVAQHDDEASFFDPNGLLIFTGVDDNLDELEEDELDDFFLGEIEYETDLWNVEGNYVQALAPVGGVMPQALVGVRYIDLDERFRLDTQDAASNPGPDDLGRIQVETRNRLIGMQVGVKGEVELSPNLTLAALVKGGVFANFAHKDADWNSGVDDPGDLEIENAAVENGDTAVATMGEFGLTATLRLHERFSVALGYSVLTIGGVALAPQLLPQNRTLQSLGRINANGRALYHGGNLKATWKFN